MSEKLYVTGEFRAATKIQEPAKSMVSIIASGNFTISDGYHTFEELYDHRITLFIALCKERDARFQQEVWRSKVNGDGSTWNGWFILGLVRAAGDQITYHIPLDRWEETDFAETLDKAPEFDGHTSQDVLERLKKLNND